MSNSNFMYAIIGAVEAMQNAVALSQIQNAITTSHASEVLKAALGEANDDLTKLVYDMESYEGDDLQRAQANYQKESQKWGSIETQLNNNVQLAQDMTARDAQHQQAIIQFASVTTGITTYVGSLLQSSY